METTNQNSAVTPTEALQDITTQHITAEQMAQIGLQVSSDVNENHKLMTSEQEALESQFSKMSGKYQTAIDKADTQ